MAKRVEEKAGHTCCQQPSWLAAPQRAFSKPSWLAESTIHIFLFKAYKFVKILTYTSDTFLPVIIIVELNIILIEVKTLIMKFKMVTF